MELLVLSVLRSRRKASRNVVSSGSLVEQCPVYGERDREFVNMAKNVTRVRRKGMEPLQGFNPTPSDSVQETFTNVLHESAFKVFLGRMG